jgi:Icc-related predicted phosphoesterase
MGGIFEKTEEKIENDLLEIEPLVNRKTVLVTHSPAHGVLDKTASGASVGSQSLLEFIRRTDVKAHIHGHIHKCFGRSGRHFNVASGRAFRAMSIDLDAPGEIEHSVITG